MELAKERKIKVRHFDLCERWLLRNPHVFTFDRLILPPFFLTKKAGLGSMAEQNATVKLSETKDLP
jgi:hypothetical protein